MAHTKDDLTVIRDGLIGSYASQSQKVMNYIQYLKEASSSKDRNGKYRNPHIRSLPTNIAINLFKKAADRGVFIDGDSITIQFIGGAYKISYDYRAYKNVITNTYPDTVWDHQLVYKGDKFAFEKINGKVIYTHTIADPFNQDKEVVGAYGIMKNARGEFIEFVNLNDIKKIRKTSKSATVWNEWFDRMVLKSVIKRICKVAFDDLTGAIDRLDNEDNYDLSEKPMSDDDHRKDRIRDWIETCESIEELRKCQSDILDTDAELKDMYGDKYSKLEEKQLEHDAAVREDA